jgi:predicted ATPase
MSAPSGIVSFLFTDIEGSTRRWEADADAMRSALAAHDDVLRQAITGYGGSLFKHTGDGVCAAFSSPRAAVNAAISAQRSLELPVRMGIATGEAEARGGDYFGAVLNRTARVMSAGHGGQILLDGQTAGLLSGVDLVDLGPRRLRDIAKPVEVFQMQAEGLRTEFPALKTVDPPPGNLRPPATSLVGRESELAELQTALKAHRLVTLTGVGGVGKTRLALEVAARLVHDFPDGVFVFELAAVSDPAAVPEAVAAVLGITQQGGMSVAESVAATLEGRSRLLVFDNCEHVLDAAANMIESILTRSTTVRILATSREGLRVDDEQFWPVPSLVDSTAGTLFIERAHGVKPDISVAEGDDVVVEICRRLDGIPLAIELAASRLVSMTVTELRDRLDNRFRLLVGSRRGLERHQTLRHAVQWSYDLLDDTERSLLARCSVFAGGFDLAAASVVAGSDDDFDTLDLLDSLVRKSLLVADTASGRTRFSMLETIRQFVQEQLAANGEADEARGAHGRYFAGRETDVLALWDGPRQREAYEWFAVELSNLRTAFRWAADHDELDTAAAIAVYATFLGHLVEQNEPFAWAEGLIKAARAVNHRRLAQLYAVAAMSHVAGRIDVAVGYAESGQAAIDSGRFDHVRDEYEVGLGAAYLTAGQPERLVEWCRALIARDPGRSTYARWCLVLALTFAGAGDEAVAASEGLLAMADAADNPHVACWALNAYGWAHRDADPADAYEAHRRGLRIAQASGNRQVESSFAVSLARLAIIHGEPEDAFDFVTLAIRRYHDSGSFSFLRISLAVLAAFLDRLGHYEPAAIISGFAATPITGATYPEFDTTITHLRSVLGDQAYESFACAGEHTTPAAMATYAFDQVDRARAQLPPSGGSQ